MLGLYEELLVSFHETEEKSEEKTCTSGNLHCNTKLA